MKKPADRRWSDKLVAHLVGWLEEAYPAEGCGLILEDGDGGWYFRECENMADRYHALDPETFPRTSRDFYMLDPREFMWAEDRQEKVAVIVHSHPDVGDYFSEEDIAAALMPRASAEEKLEPLYPGTDYLVVSVRRGKADGASLYRFDTENEEFALAGKFDGQALRSALRDTSAKIETVA